MKIKFKGWSSFILLAILFFNVYITFGLDEEAICTNVSGFWDVYRYECVFANLGQNPSGIDFSYNVTYPTRMGDASIIQTTLSNYLQNLITDFQTEVDAMTTSPGPLFMNIQFQIFEFDDNTISVLFTREVYLGGPHPNYFADTFAFDTANNQVLMLEDLFVSGADYLSVITPIVRADLLARLGAGFATDIDNGTTPIADNYRNFVITDDALIFFYDPGHIGPFVAGGVSARVPLSDLTSIWVIGDDASPVLKG